MLFQMFNTSNAHVLVSSTFQIFNISNLQNYKMLCVFLSKKQSFKLTKEKTQKHKLSKFQIFTTVPHGVGCLTQES